MTTKQKYRVSNQSAIQQEMGGFLTDLKSGSCTEFPSFHVDLPLYGNSIDLGSEINRYPFLLLICRMLGRMVGGICGFMLVFRSVQNSNTSMNG